MSKRWFPQELCIPNSFKAPEFVLLALFCVLKHMTPVKQLSPAKPPQKVHLFLQDSCWFARTTATTGKPKQVDDDPDGAKLLQGVPNFGRYSWMSWM